MKQLILFAFLSLFFVGCKSTKGLSKGKAPKNNTVSTVSAAIDRLESQQLDFEDLQTKVKCKYKGGGRSLSFKSTIRIEKDKQIWISAGMFGFEAARALVTPERVQVVNRIERTYYDEPVSKIQEIAGLPVEFNELQNLILGNIIFMDKESATFSRKDEKIELISQLNELVNIVWLDDSYQMKQQTLVDQPNQQEMEIVYENYQEVATNKYFPYQSKVHVTGEKELWVDLEFQQVEVNTKPSFAFKINSNYKRITF